MPSLGFREAIYRESRQISWNFALQLFFLEHRVIVVIFCLQSCEPSEWPRLRGQQSEGGHFRPAQLTTTQLAAALPRDAAQQQTD
jgi:hypothetical protein